MVEEKKNTTWAYLRVSTDAQDVDNQRLEVLRLANDRGLGQVLFIEDPGVSGRVPWRERKIAAVLEQMRPGDALVVAELSRLGRSMYEIMEILALAVQRQVRVYAVKGGWELTDSIQSKILAMVFAMAAEIERDLNRQRTRAAMAQRKAMAAAGKTWVSKAGNVVRGLGRPPGPGPSKLDRHETQIRERLALGVPITRIAAAFDTTPGNLRHWQRQRGITAGTGRGTDASGSP